jgi:hypothetical protein
LEPQERTGRIDCLGHDCLAASIIEVLGNASSIRPLVVESFVSFMDGRDSRPKDGACREGDESGLHTDNAIVCSCSRERIKIFKVSDSKERPLNE